LRPRAKGLSFVGAYQEGASDGGGAPGPQRALTRERWCGWQALQRELKLMEERWATSGSDGDANGGDSDSGSDREGLGRRLDF
jgi:hypothetical protein